MSTCCHGTLYLTVPRTIMVPCTVMVLCTSYRHGALYLVPSWYPVPRTVTVPCTSHRTSCRFGTLYLTLYLVLSWYLVPHCTSYRYGTLYLTVPRTVMVPLLLLLLLNICPKGECCLVPADCCVGLGLFTICCYTKNAPPPPGWKLLHI